MLTELIELSIELLLLPIGFSLLICFTMFLTGIIMNIIQCFLYFALRPWSKYLFRKINYYLCYSFYSQMHCIIDWHSKSELYVYVDKEDMKYFGKEHAFVIMNHKYVLDWTFLADFSEKFGIAGNFKAFMKKTVGYIPAIGWSIYFSENVLLERSFGKDKENISRQLNEVIQYPDPIWLFFAPEGTRFSERKHAESVKLAKERGLPILKHHLLPKPKGFITSIPILRKKSIPIYDATMTVSPKDKTEPTLVNICFGKQIKVHLYIKRIPIENVPMDEGEAIEFLNNLFIQKDKLQDSFFKTDDYFKESNIKRIEPFIMKRRYVTLINAVMWNIIIVGLIFYYIIYRENIFIFIGIPLFSFFVFIYALQVNKVKE